MSHLNRRPLTTCVLLLLSLLVGLGLPVGIAAAAFAAEGPPSLDTRTVDAYLRNQVNAGLPGVAVAITQGDQVLFVRGYGHDSAGAQIGEETPFRIASLSKSFTALAVMQLVEDGRLRLDDPVAEHLSGFSPDDARADEITVQQLLSQTSGMADRAFPEISRPQPSTLVEAVRRLDSVHLVADPGTQWNYHNPNYHVAARLVEVASGLPFDEYLRRRVFEPLGMHDSTTTNTDDQPVAGLADGYTFAYGQSISTEAPGYFVAGSGGVVTTAFDMAKWLMMQNSGGETPDGEQLLSAEGIETMHTQSEPGGYALGWDTDGPTDDPTEVSHGGTEYTFSAHEALLPNSGYGIALLFNHTSALGLEQTAVIEGVTDIVQGGKPMTGPTISSETVDWILAALTLIALVLGIRGLLRARRWARRRTGVAVWRTCIRFLPHAGLVGVAVFFPAVARFLFGGRGIAWLSAVYGWGALVVLVAVIGIASLTTAIARAAHLHALRRRELSAQP
jgi:CubicO group peptidase (beta-lactamase class C family)